MVLVIPKTYIFTSPRRGNIVIKEINKDKIIYTHNSSSFTIYIDFIIEAYRYFYGKSHVTVKDIEDFHDSIYKGMQSKAHCNYMFFIVLMSELFGIPINEDKGRGAPFYIDL